MKKDDDQNKNKKKGKNSEKKDKLKKENEKDIEKNYIDLFTEERANLKQYAKRKYISMKALKQINALLLFDNKKTVTVVMEEVAVSPQTLKKWREQFDKDRMDSLLVILEKKKEDEKKRKGGDDKKEDENKP